MQQRNQNASSRSPKFLIATFFILAGFVASFVLGVTIGRHDLNLPSLSQASSTATPTFGLVERVWNILKAKSLHQPLDEKQAIYGAIQGMVATLNDPYTEFFNPDEEKTFQQEIEGTFEGIGAEIGKKDTHIVVIAPLTDSPAERAGLQAGDVIQAIDGATTDGMTLDEVVAKIRGKQGTTVTLTIVHDSDEPKDIIITRDTITVDSIRYQQLDGHIADIRISYFGPKTSDDFFAAVNRAKLDGSKGMILDMRGNPGGLLDSAIDIAGTFFAKGTTIVAERNAAGTTEQHASDLEPLLPTIPLVVLVDGGSASGAEIVAGALQDYHRGTLIGTTTFGKGTVQQLEELPTGAGLKVTVAEWLTPSGRSINKNGIEPDIKVENTAKDETAGKDAQHDRALEELTKLLEQQ